MTLMDGSFMGLQHQHTRSAGRSLGLEVAALLRDRFPHHTAKSVAQILRCTVKTAENILAGHLSGRTATMLIEAFGPGFMADAVMASAGTTLVNFIRSQAAEAEATAHRHQQKARELAQLETQLRASRRSESAGSVGLAP